MPKSKKRKKNGKTVGNGEKTRLERFENMESGVTLQDLINVVAYQEYVETGEIVPEKVAVAEIELPLSASDVKINMPEDLPVTITGEDGRKIRIGSATAVEGDPERVSVFIDEEHRDKLWDEEDMPNFSIGPGTIEHQENNHGQQ